MDLPKKPKVDYAAQGKANRIKGAVFERKVRKHMEKIWIIDKWTNNIDLDKDCIVPAKSNRFGSRSCGFPDFVCIAQAGAHWKATFKVKWVEAKFNGYLKPIERQKMDWMVEKGMECWVAFDSDGVLKFKKYLQEKKPDRLGKSGDRNNVR